MKILPAVLVVCLAAAEPAEAQIYTWRDASGQLVLSNKPRTGGEAKMRTCATPGSDELRAGALPTTTPPPARQPQTPYDDLIREQAAEHGLSPALVRAVIQAESAFNPRAVSPKGAMGLMQLMPATARELGVRDAFQPADNIRGGVRYLAQLMTRYDHDVELALAAYNAGPGSVDRYDDVPPYRETRAYVKKITGVTADTVRVPPAPPPVIYKWLDLAGGTPAIRYSNVPPKHIAYEIVGKR